MQLTEEEESALQILLDQCKTHQDWVQFIDRIKRLKDVIKTAAEITDVSMLEKNIERIQWELQQELASEGLKQYRIIYDNFIGPVSEIQRELDTMIRLAETRSKSSVRDHTNGDNDNNQQNQLAEVAVQNEAKEEIHDSLIDLRALFERSNKKEADFLRYLIELSEQHKIYIYWKSDIQ